MSQCYICKLEDRELETTHMYFVCSICLERLRARVEELEKQCERLRCEKANQGWSNLSDACEQLAAEVERLRVREETLQYSIRNIKNNALMVTQVMAEETDTLRRELEEARGEIEKRTWRTDEPPVDEPILAIVKTKSGAEYFICRIDEGGTLVDLEYGDDYGWQWDCIDMWVHLETIADILRLPEPPDGNKPRK